MLGRNSGFVARSFARIFFVMMVYLVTVSVSVCWKCRVITCVYKLPGCSVISFMLSGRSHVFAWSNSLLCNNICHMSRYAERSHKSEKKR